MADRSPDLEQLLVRAIEAGLTGSAHDARQIAMRLARPGRRRPSIVSDETRTALEALVADPELAARSAQPTARSAPSLASRELTTSWETNGGAAPPGDRGTLTRERVADIAAPVLPAAVFDRLQRVIREQSRREQLLAAGIRPTSTLLLSGPPGVGKTHTARWLASELGLELAHIEPAIVLSSLLGRSGQNLAAMLADARRRPCVVLIDEFDALAKRRDDTSDVGELKRLVTVLLLELDRWPAGHLLIAATNHPHLLDSAVLRRFDHRVELGLPDVFGRRSMLTDALERRGVSISSGLLDALVEATEDSHGGTLVSLADDIARAVVVDDTDPDAAAADAALELFTERHGDPAHGRDAFCWVAHRYGGMSMRELARRLGVSHPTVSSAVERFDRQAG